jgi:1-pyrroline-5-carboxylate dehydrogenase
MNNAIYSIQNPDNEPIMSYAPGCHERAELEKELKRISSETIEIPLIINSRPVRTGTTGRVVLPHDHAHLLAT